ncbi:MAG: hypothetical protein WA324_02975 [Bryobacteraceae bacterium]
MSDIVLAKRMEDLKGPADDSDPFQFGGKLVSNQLIPSTPAPDQSGRVQVRFGITAIPGSYKLIVKATQGSNSAERTLDYSVSAN